VVVKQMVVHTLMMLAVAGVSSRGVRSVGVSASQIGAGQPGHEASHLTFISQTLVVFTNSLVLGQANLVLDFFRFVPN
jgi:hypothetical protein